MKPKRKHYKVKQSGDFQRTYFHGKLLKEKCFGFTVSKPLTYEALEKALKRLDRIYK